MGIHIHRAGCPPHDMCGCCDLRTRLDALYDRTHNAILSINGQTPDGQGAITLELLEQAAVQSIIDDHIDPLRETVDELSITVESWNPVFEDYAHILRKVDIDLPDLITANHQYTAAVADDLLQNHYTKTQADGRFALQSELDTYAKDSDLVAALDAMVRRSGNSTPQVITGTGGLMLQGDLSVGGDITGSSDTYLHFDTVRQMELAGMTVRKDGAVTRLANSNGLSINGLFMSDMVSTIKTELQTLRGPLAGPSATDSSPSNVYVTKANVMSTDGKMNNLVHRIGEETIDGRKTFTSPINGMCYFPLIFRPFVNSTKWWKVCALKPQRAYIIEITKSFPYNNGSRYYAKALINISRELTQGYCHVLNIISRGASGSIGDIILGQTAHPVEGGSTTYSYELFVKQTANANLRVNCLEVMSTTTNYGPEDITIIDEESQDPQTIEGLFCIVEAET